MPVFKCFSQQSGVEALLSDGIRNRWDLWNVSGDEAGISVVADLDWKG